MIDVYLPPLAARHEGMLSTFDKGLKALETPKQKRLVEVTDTRETCRVQCVECNV